MLRERVAMYMYEFKDWPRFSWDQKKLSALLVKIRYQQGNLIGRMETIDFRQREETILNVLTQDVVKSSQIEGEILDQSLVRSSVSARKREHPRRIEHEQNSLPSLSHDCYHFNALIR